MNNSTSFIFQLATLNSSHRLLRAIRARSTTPKPANTSSSQRATSYRASVSSTSATSISRPQQTSLSSSMDATQEVSQDVSVVVEGPEVEKDSNLVGLDANEGQAKEDDCKGRFVFKEMLSDEDTAAPTYDQLEVSPPLSYFNSIE